MTVTYSLNVANARLSGFSKLLIRWKGSIYKLLYREMIIFCSLYYSLSFLYRYILTDTQRIVFEKLSLYCEAFTALIPLSFVLGFYVSIVVSRWWQQFMQIPWPDKLVMLVSGNIHGSDERGRMIRRTLARYLVLLQTLTCQAVSTSVRKRFPTLDHVEEAGLMTKEERIVYDEVPGTHGKWWVPTQWFTALAVRSRKEGRIKDDILLQQILDELHVFRSCCGMMFAYDWISIPLVYTQTVTIATYTFFIANVMGRQYLDPSKGYSNHDVDLYIPIFTLLEFFFFMGWLKVAEQLINPYGEDDDDFELNWCLDRNLLISFWIVDEMYNKHPRLVKDMYWDDIEPTLPYTKSSIGLRTAGGHMGSAMQLDIDPEDTEFLPLETIMEDDNERTYSSPPTSPTDLVSLGSQMKMDKESETASHSGLRFLPESFRGSRLLNMIIGQSNENVAQTPTRMTDKSQHPLIPPFILKTPKKRARTASMADALNHNTNRMHLASSSVQMSVIGSNSEFPGGPAYGDLPTAPVFLHHLRPSPAIATPNPGGDRRSMLAETGRGGDEAQPQEGQLGPRPRPPSEPESGHGFRFPAAYVAPQTPQHYFNHLVTQVDDQKVPLEDVTTEVTTPRTAGTRCSSRLGVVDTIITVDEESQEAIDKQAKEAKEAEEAASPFEPNLSQESLTPYGSNQSTVTSITELLSKEKKKEK